MAAADGLDQLSPGWKPPVVDPQTPSAPFVSMRVRVLPEVAPTTSDTAQPSQTRDTAGVQTAAISADCTALTVLVIEPLARVVNAIATILPSTGGRSAVALAVGSLGVGRIALWLRRAGRNPPHQD